MSSKPGVSVLRSYLLWLVVGVGLLAAMPGWADAGAHFAAPMQPQALGDPGTLAAGANHTCTITDAGSVKCWGYNTSGQLGNNSTTDSHIPVTVSGITDATALLASGGHTCALTGTGTVKCWGNNGRGQLGNNSTTNSPIPVTVSGITDATALSAWGSHTCALTGTGTVKCWGYNGAGQLGINSTTDYWFPVTVSGITDATALSAGAFHTCALTGTGTVRCWGSNTDGQLGDNSTTNRWLPVTVSGITDATALSAGYYHTCALTGTGTVQCWGKNTDGQLGNNSTANSLIPVTVSGITDATALSAGYNDTCALTGTGMMQCWGFNGQGQLGNNSNVQSLVPVTVSNISDATALSVGGGHTCALTGTGMMQCWGYNGQGQLGTESMIDSWIPVTVFGSPFVTYFTLTYTPGPNGSLSGDVSQTVAFGANGTPVTAVPETGYHFTQWGDASTDNPRTETAVSVEISVTANFAPNSYTVSFDSQGGSVVTAITQDFGTTVTVPGAPTRTGYSFVNWNLVADGSGTAYAPAATFPMPANDSTLYAIWTIDRYIVTTTSSGQGSITPASQMINHGDTASFVVTPDAGYSAAVSGDNCSVNPSAGTTWTSTAIEADCEVTAIFALIPVAVLEIDVDDGQNFARYGSMLNYIVTVANTGTTDAINVSLSNSVPTQLDAAFTTWRCIGAGNGATCPASGSGDLNSTGIALPANRSLYWLVTAPVQAQALGDTVEYTVEAHLSVTETVSDNDIDTLVIYRGGFDALHEDGGNVGDPELNACTLDTPFATFDDASVWTFSPSAMTSTHPIQVIATALDSSALGIRIEQLNMEQTPLIRIVSIAGDGGQRASAWVDVRADAPLALATIKSTAGDRTMMLVGASEPVEIKLPTGIAETLQFQASASVNSRCH